MFTLIVLFDLDISDDYAYISTVWGIAMGRNWFCDFAVVLILVAGCDRSGGLPGDEDSGTEPPGDAMDGDDGSCCDDSWPDAGDGLDGDPDAADGMGADRGDQDGEDGEDGDSRADLDLGEDFGLLVLDGTQVCAEMKHYNLFVGYQHRGRITFQGGLVRLPRNLASFELNWIDKVELGPQRAVPVPTAPGTFTGSINGTEDDGKYRYEYRQPFDLNGEPYEVAYQVWFRVQGGVAVVDPLQVFDEGYLSEADGYRYFHLTGTFSNGMQHYFTTCLYDLYKRIHHEVTVANFDRLQMEQRMHMSGACGECCPATLVRAVFQRGQERREVTDFFRLAYTDGQHNWGQQFLVVFDHPVDSVYGVYLQQAEMSHPARKVDYLDADLNILESVDISSYQITEE